MEPTLSGCVRTFARDSGPAIAIVGHDATLDWVALDALADRQAKALTRFAPGSRVVVLLPQHAASVALLAACERAQLDAILVSALYGEAWARARCEALSASALVTLCADGAVEIVYELSQAPRPVSAEPGVLVMTSGTTGEPRCARHTWQTLGGAVKLRPRQADVCWLVGYPLSHFAALQVVAQVVFGGATLIVPPDFSAETAIRLLTTHGVELLCATPSYVRQVLIAASPEDWQRTHLVQVTLGGEISDAHLLHGLRDAKPGLRVTHVYASTELGAVLTVRDGEEGFDAALLDGERLKIVDGELHARRTARTMLGYIDGTAPRGDAGDGWVATGDLIEVKDGRARFHGRIDDRITVGGYKVSPVEVENAIRGVAGVRDVCVVGHKSSILGSLPKAIVVAEPTADRVALQAEIVRECTAVLAPYMVPRLFEFTESLERSVAQKRMRRG